MDYAKCNVISQHLPRMTERNYEKPQSGQRVSAEIRTVNFPMEATSITTSQLPGRGADSLINYSKVLKNHCQTDEARGEIFRRVHS